MQDLITSAERLTPRVKEMIAAELKLKQGQLILGSDKLTDVQHKKQKMLKQDIRILKARLDGF